ncbi:MAG: TPM domain-containing protein, partial [Acidobacteria bacterium]|nr:TPM domain-containing protein [Acidobacteriota bacterium]
MSAQTQDFQIPQPTGNAVNDFAGVIDSGTKARLEQILINLKKEQQIEFGVVTVKTTGGREIFDYGMAIARGWGIGPGSGDKQGLLLLIAVDDRKYQTLTSRHLQGELTDSNVGSIQRQFLIPALREGDYGKALMDTVRAYIDTLAMERGFSTATIYQETSPSTPRQAQPRRRPSTGGGLSSCVWIVIIIFALIFLFGSRGRGGGGSGCLNMLFLGSMLSNMGRGSGWSGGGFGGSSGGGGGGFGG